MTKQNIKEEAIKKILTIGIAVVIAAVVAGCEKADVERTANDAAKAAYMTALDAAENAYTDWETALDALDDAQTNLATTEAARDAIDADYKAARAGYKDALLADWEAANDAWNDAYADKAADYEAVHEAALNAAEIVTALVNWKADGEANEIAAFADWEVAITAFGKVHADYVAARETWEAARAPVDTTTDAIATAWKNVLDTAAALDAAEAASWATLDISYYEAAANDFETAGDDFGSAVAANNTAIAVWEDAYAVKAAAYKVAREAAGAALNAYKVALADFETTVTALEAGD